MSNAAIWIAGGAGALALAYLLVRSAQAEPAEAAGQITAMEVSDMLREVGLFAGINAIASPAITLTQTGAFRVSVNVKNPGSQSTSYNLNITMAKAGTEYQRGIGGITLAPGQTASFSVDFTPSLAGISAWPVGVYDIFADLRLGNTQTILDTKKLSAEVTVAAPPSGEVVSMTTTLL